MAEIERGEIVTTTKPFGQFLLEQRNGALHGELSDRLREVVEGVVQHGKAGALTLLVTVKPSGVGAQFLVTDEVRVKVPEADRGASLFFADQRGNLSRSDPRQPELPLREVMTSEPEVREVQ